MGLFYFITLLLKIISLIHSKIIYITGHSHKILTTTQFLSYIDDKILARRYTASMKPKECVVCLSSFEKGESVRELTCEHVFHKDCIDKWLQQCRSNCPMCRAGVLPDKVVLSYRMEKDDAEEYYARTKAEPIFLVFSSQSMFQRFLSIWRSH